MSAFRAAVLGSLAILAACSGGARPQWKVYLATDAPVPQLGQEVLVELIDASGNDVSPDATQLIDGSTASLWPISFGVAPAGGASSSPRLRVRLYRLDETASGGGPQGTALIDMTATLPPVGSGVTPVSMTLAGACFGVAPDRPHRLSCDPATGKLGPEPTLASGADVAALPKPGSWAAAAAVPCGSSLPAGMKCAPGGLVLLGSTRFYPRGTDIDPAPEQLVLLRPFAIDVDEMTVGQVRQLVLSAGLSPPQSGDPDPIATPPECTYLSSDDASHDSYPLNCVSWTQATAVCAELGKRLPTEAEWEYVASNLAQKTLFPWGTSGDVCGHARVGHGRAAIPAEDTECEDGGTFGPVPGGAPLDVTALGIRNLGGSMNEWVADTFEPYTGPCWQPQSTLLVAPSPCSVMETYPAHSVRGGAWSEPPLNAYAYLRNESIIGDQPAVATGFRCAASM